LHQLLQREGKNEHYVRYRLVMMLTLSHRTSLPTSRSVHRYTCPLSARLRSLCFCATWSAWCKTVPARTQSRLLEIHAIGDVTFTFYEHDGVRVKWCQSLMKNGASIKMGKPAIDLNRSHKFEYARSQLIKWSADSVPFLPVCVPASQALFRSRGSCFNVSLFYVYHKTTSLAT
jgi:hypothetical protein